MLSTKHMWEILVPTVRPNTCGEKYFRTRYHRVWDAKVRDITGGMTIMPPTRGQWVSPHGVLFEERMIPVRLLATREDIECEGFDYALVHYDDYSAIPDAQFQSLYKAYLTARENLVNHLGLKGRE